MFYGFEIWILDIGYFVYGYLVYKIWLWILGLCIWMWVIGYGYVFYGFEIWILDIMYMSIWFMRFGYRYWVSVFGCGLLDMGMCLWV